jgi:hypothetical protein
MGILLIVLMIIFLVYVIVHGYILANQKLYCRFYEKESWKKWEELLKKTDNIHLDIIFRDGTCWFNLDDEELSHYRITLGYENDHYTSFVSDKKDCSCILSGFDKYHSNILTNKLLEILEKEKTSASIIDYNRIIKIN